MSTTFALPYLADGEVRQDDDLLLVVVAAQQLCEEVAGGGEEHGVGGLVAAVTRHQHRVCHQARRVEVVRPELQAGGGGHCGVTVLKYTKSCYRTFLNDDTSCFTVCVECTV